ncbi:MAG: MBL fold metallo-hydrolase [Phenylobacterium sp.]|nr:MBL fold metallo-hydrolase [Rhodobacter sp.]MCA6225539.1 MBL fold metallo-hydrolase [Phenylobacterium sp.]MCA6250109.1 MBL fold metallo-hydrolase [Phenylobacterium sp.]MCA6258961.1 MBL fold metallo-hydrolase [Phenylobacterium sp.]MCA6267874.1 MBL fold metallo-hydrolase [Phenylobacterium sp.]
MEVARHWRRRRNIGGFVLITEPHVVPLLRSNIWMVSGRDRDLVIDAGLGLVPLRPYLPTDADRPVTLVATHAHRDHVGAAHEFLDLCAHRLEAQAIEEATDDIPLDVSMWPDELLAGFERKGYQCRCGTLSALPFSGFSAVDEHLKPARVSQLVDEGDIIDLGDQCFEVLHLPGHSPGSIGLFQRSTGAFFSGDVIYDGPLLDDIEGADRGAYCRTMERLLSLPVRSVFPGHGPAFGRSRLLEIARHYLRTWERLR